MRRKSSMTYSYVSKVLVIIILVICWHHKTLLISRDHGMNLPEAQNDVVITHDWEREMVDYRSQTCQAPKSIYMLRVPKTGSTTLLNIMYRYVKKHRLKMPHLYRELIASRNYIVREDLMYPLGAPPPPFGSYGFYGEHIAFNESDVDHVLGPGSFKLASVRNPLPQFRSIFKEWHMAEDMHLSADDPVKEYLARHLRSNHVPGDKTFYTHSLSARHFGLTKENYQNRSAINDVIEVADQAFDLVMVNEFYDESLILLKRRLCWETKDILYIPNRIGRHKITPSLMTWEVEHQLQTMSPADYAVYRHFAKKLLHEIGQEDYFWQELGRFKTMNRQVYDFCLPVYSRLRQNITSVFEVVKESGSLTLDPSPFGRPFSVSHLDCLLMNLYTMAFRTMLAVGDYPQLCDVMTEDTYHVCGNQYKRVDGISLDVLAEVLNYNTLNMQ